MKEARLPPIAIGAGTDEQKPHMRLLNEDKQARLVPIFGIIAKSETFKNRFSVDAAGIGGGNMFLPGENLMKEYFVRESAEAIVG